MYQTGCVTAHPVLPNRLSVIESKHKLWPGPADLHLLVGAEGCGFQHTECHPRQLAYTFLIRILSTSLTSLSIFSVCCYSSVSISMVQKYGLWRGRGFSCEQSCCPDKFSSHCKLGQIPDYGGRILGRNPDKSLQSFPPCCSQSHQQLCLEIFIFSNSCNFLRISTVQLLYTSKDKGEKVEKPPEKPYPLSYGLRNPYRNLKSGLCSETSTKLCSFMNSASVRSTVSSHRP